jgi:aspartyl aminopeptidase
LGKQPKNSSGFHKLGFFLTQILSHSLSHLKKTAMVTKNRLLESSNVTSADVAHVVSKNTFL